MKGQKCIPIDKCLPFFSPAALFDIFHTSTMCPSKLHQWPWLLHLTPQSP